MASWEVVWLDHFEKIDPTHLIIKLEYKIKSDTGREQIREQQNDQNLSQILLMEAWWPVLTTIEMQFLLYTMTKWSSGTRQCIKHSWTLTWSGVQSCSASHHFSPPGSSSVCVTTTYNPKHRATISLMWYLQ